MHKLLPVIAVVLLAGCGSSSKSATSTTSSTPPPAASAPATSSGDVQIKNFLYAPAKITVKVGGMVKFTNQDSAPHTATPDSGSAFDSGTLNQGQSKAITFKTPGTYAYHCVFHAFMHGSVVVTS
ncbi:MAG: cupredoxin family copper-binding protein [Solirubrobacteraceae bacterium]